MREIKTHHINGCNEAITIMAKDGPGPGGASHHYTLAIGEGITLAVWQILFQNGPVKENGEGVNGLTHEALLAVLIDRLQGFQQGPYQCKENNIALDHLTSALEWLNVRTLRRDKQGIEGTMALDDGSRPRQISARDGRKVPGP